MKKKTRKDCIFGIHFDIHVLPGETVVADKRPGYLKHVLDEIKPEYVQIDTKGHYGQSSYHTKVGHTARIEYDWVSEWREETRKRGILLYAHHSGLIDHTVAEQHPEWCVVDAKGNVSKTTLSIFSPYIDEFLMPQLCELASDFGFDGLWMDGFLWSYKDVDYSPMAQDAYFKKTGKKAAKPGEESYEDYFWFIRNALCHHTFRYAEVLSDKFPGFEIAENGGFWYDIADKPTRGFAFTSKDVHNASEVLDRSRDHARTIMNHPVPFDCMGFGGNYGPGGHTYEAGDYAIKTGIQFCQEAAVPISCGGGYECCNATTHDFKNRTTCTTPMDEWAIKNWKMLSEFCQARKKFCLGANNIPQAAIYFSKAAAEKTRTKPFQESDEIPAYQAVRGCAAAILDQQYSVAILMTYMMLEKDLSEFSLIVVPEVSAIEPEVVGKLKNYVKNGGNLLLASAKTAMYFKDMVGADWDFHDKRIIYIDGGDHVDSIFTSYSDFVLEAAKPLSYRTELTSLLLSDKWPISIVNPYGKGKVGTIGFDFGTGYLKNRMVATRDMIQNQLNELFPEPLVKVSGSHFIDVSLMDKDGMLMINLLNRTGEHNNYNARNYDEIPPLYDINLAVKWDGRPAEVYAEPEHKKLETRIENDRLCFRIEKLHIHTVIAVKTL